MLVLQYETMGTPVEDPDHPAMNCGYDNVRTGLMIVSSESDFDMFDPEDTRSVRVIHEQPTLGL